MTRRFGFAALMTGALLIATVAPASAESRQDELWVARFNGAASLADTTTATVTSPDGQTVYVTGNSTFGSRKTQYATVAYDTATGSERWDAESVEGVYGSTAEAIAISPDGATLVVTGLGTHGAFTVAYDAATGATLWTASDADLAYAFGIAVSADGSVVAIVGNSGYFSSMTTVGYDLATGTQLWTVSIQDGGFEVTTGKAIVASPDGHTFFSTGYAYNGNSEEYMTEAITVATGKKEWAARYNSPNTGYDESLAIAVSPDASRVFVTGCSGGVYCIGTSYGTVAYDAHSGKTLWIRTYNGGAHAIPKAIGVSPDSSKVFVTGTVGGNTAENYGTIAYDAATGTPLWSATYDGPSADRDYANALGVSPDGARVYVTGGSVGPTKQDYGTVAYDAITGAEIWVERYDGPTAGTDVATALAVGPDGTVFVTGQSSGIGTFSDYATVAYSG
jgi:sugar lactone lactonase YvrE